MSGKSNNAVSFGGYMQITTIAAQDLGKRNSLWKRVCLNRYAYIFVGVSLAYYLLFSYAPMYGVLLAFKQYKASKGILFSPFIGLAHYYDIFGQREFWRAFANTVIISFSRIVVEFPVPIILAILINEINARRYKKVLQTVYTFPHFLSWVIVASISLNLMGNDGLFNNILEMMGMERQQIMANKDVFRPIIYITDIWKESGWGAIIYLAAITSIPIDHYEAAIIDGANRWHKVLHITLPGMQSTIVVMLLLSIGNTMNAGFDQIFNMYNSAVYEVSDILDTYIFRVTFETGSVDFGFSTAVGLFRSVINFSLLLLFNSLAKRLGESSLF
jgi:putative aldouronate transport system permease protein